MQLSSICPDVDQFAPLGRTHWHTNDEQLQSKIQIWFLDLLNFAGGYPDFGIFRGGIFMQAHVKTVKGPPHSERVSGIENRKPLKTNKVVCPAVSSHTP